jgi:hypothetical protein
MADNPEYKYKKYKRKDGSVQGFLSIYSIGMWLAGSMILVAELQDTNFDLAIAISILVLSVVVSNIRY